MGYVLYAKLSSCLTTTKHVVEFVSIILLWSIFLLVSVS